MNEKLKPILKPCPFCGAAGWLRECPKDRRKRPVENQYRVTCELFHSTKCRAEAATKWVDTVDEAIGAWNTRAQTSD